MTTLVHAVTARIPHLCDTCHWRTGLRGVATIGSGHRYLRHVTFPDEDVNASARPVRHKECVACATDRESSAGLLVAGACATYCCGDVPCALPFRHDGDHECLRCTTARQLEVVPAWVDCRV